MGLIKQLVDNAVTSVTSVLADQYKTAINCGDMGNEILMVKKTKPNGIIRDGSRIIVNPGQLAVLVDNGTVIDATAEQGVFEFSTEASPSFFAGGFGAMFKEMWTRFTFGAGVFQDQAVYFINVKEIIGNRFGTPRPIMYRDWEHASRDLYDPAVRIPLKVDIQLTGNYTFQIERPDIFLKRIGGTAAIYQKDELCEQMRSEIISCVQMLTNSLCSEQNKVNATELPSQSDFIKELMRQNRFDAAIQERGLTVQSLNIETVNMTAESAEAVRTFERSRFAGLQQDKVTDAIQMAAQNEGGAGVGFLNLSMLGGATGGATAQMVGNTMAGAMAPPPAYTPPPSAPASAPVPQRPDSGVTPPVPQHPESSVAPHCTNCGAAVTGKFCAACGAPAPVPTAPVAQFCSNCGAKASGKFCAECGNPL